MQRIREQDSGNQNLQLILDIIAKIHQCWQVEDLWQTIVYEIYHLLAVDRVLIYRFCADGSIKGIQKSVDYEYDLDENFLCKTFEQEYHQILQNREIITIEDISITDKISLQTIEYLHKWQVQAILVMPIVLKETVWGLFVIHNCQSCRPWLQTEIEIIKQLINQVVIAVNKLEYWEDLPQNKEKYTSTSRKLIEPELLQDAFHDPVTSLPNRALFMTRLGHSLTIAKQREDYLFAVLFLDLDRFKVINDSLGHLAGNQLLKDIAYKLQSCISPGDTLASLGGDEFVILLENIKNIGDAINVAERIQQILKSPFNLNGHEIFTTVSIGITLGGSCELTPITCHNYPENFLRDADIAMYRAKAKGKAGYEIFNAEMHLQAVALLQLETDLRKTIYAANHKNQQLRLEYQPIVSLETGLLVGFEALIRWHHPQRGLISPTEFIPLAEETGLIIPMDLWVLQEACQQMQIWQTQFPSNPPLTISVNLSVKHFLQSDLVTKIQRVLQLTGLASESLKLEITESLLMENQQHNLAILSQLNDLGIQLHLDDFGTGYSSLNYLHCFPVDKLKIDRSFIMRMGKNGENSEIIRTIVTLAHDLGMSVTAEGVETVEQLIQLKSIQCDSAQGYYLSKPISKDIAVKLVENSCQGIPIINFETDLNYYLVGKTINGYCNRPINSMNPQINTPISESEKRFTTIFQGAAIGIALIDINGKILESNTALQQMLGYNQEELVNQSLAKFSHVEDIAIDLKFYQALISGKQDDYQLENRYLRRDGHLVWGRVTVSLVRGRGGEPQFAISMIEDITAYKQAELSLQKIHEQLEIRIAERTAELNNINQQLAKEIIEHKRTEEALRESEQRYRYLIETAAEGIWIIDVENKTTFANQKIADMLGYTIDEMLGKSLFEFMDEEGKIIANMQLDRRRHGISEQHDFKFQRKNGLDLWAIINTNPILDQKGNYIGVLGMLTDITERKQQEEILKQYQLLSQHDRDIVLFTRLDGQIIEANHAAVNAYGYERDYLLSLNINNLRNPKNIIEIDKNMLFPKGDSVLFETEHIRKDKTIFPVEVSSQIAMLGNEEFCFQIIRDITERKQAELLLYKQTECERLVAAISQHIHQVLDLNYILNTTVTEVREFLNCDRVLIYRLWSDGTGSTVNEAISSNCLPILGRTFPSEIFPESSHEFYLQGRIHAINNIYNDTLSPCLLEFLEELQVKSKLVVPIIQSGKLWGLLIAHHCTELREWQLLEIDLLSNLAMQVAIAIQQSELYHQLHLANQELQRLAFSDGLTKIANRRYFDQYLEQQWKRLNNQNDYISLILCDIDYFKLYNDTYGHQKGDDCLQKVAEAISTGIRHTTDLVARYGGEEFAIILPNTEPKEAMITAERIRAEVESLKIQHSRSEIYQYVTLSVGVASLMISHESSPTMLISAADKSLYKAKSNGRNCIIYS